MTAKRDSGAATTLRSRPDNAYYLLVGLAVVVTLITFGSLLIYVGYWPQVAMSNFWKRHAELAAEHFENEKALAQESPTIYLNNNGTVLNDKNGGSPGHSYDAATPHPHLHSFTVLRVLGPLLGVAGCALLVVIIVIGARINWEAVPDAASATVNFAKLKSELKLNILGGAAGTRGTRAGVSASKYELMVPIEMDARPSTSGASTNLSVPVPSTSKSTSTSAMPVTKPICSGSEPSAGVSAASSMEFLNDFNSNKIHIVEIL